MKMWMLALSCAAVTAAKYQQGVAVFTIAKGGQKFKFTPLPVPINPLAKPQSTNPLGKP